MCDSAVIDRIRRNALCLQGFDDAIIVVIVGQCLIILESAWVRFFFCSFSVVKRGEIVAAIVLMVFHDFLLLLHNMFDSGLLLLFPSCFLSFLRVGREGLRGRVVGRVFS